MKVSRRLQKIVNQIQGNCLADIGCDHGYVVIQALCQNRIQKAYACDIASGPLENARQNILKAGLEKRAFCIQMNGIQSLPEDVDTLVMAGMGGTLIIDILSQGKRYLHSGMRLYLSPHKDVDQLRIYLSDHDMHIEKEHIIAEDGHFYPLLEVLILSGTRQVLTEDQILYGIHCVKNEEYWAYINAEYQKWSAIYKKMPAFKNQEAQKRISLLEKRIKEQDG